MRRTNSLTAVALHLTLLLSAGLVFGQQTARPRVIPSDFLRAWDPVTLVFDRDLGPEGGGPADDPGSLFELAPRQPGEYRWVDRRTLQFLPASPWPPLSTITIRSQGSERILYTLMSPPNSVTPSDGSTDLDPVDRVELVLPAWVDPDRLAAMVQIEARPLPGLAGQEVIGLDQSDFTVRVQDPQPGSSTSRVVIELAEALGYGMDITFALRLAEAVTADAHVARYRFSTRPLFRLTDMGSGGWQLPVSANGSVYAVDRALGISDPASALYLEFSEPLGPLSLEEVRRLVQFTPAVRNFSFEVTNTRLYFHLDADPEIPYELRVNHQPILSAAGRTLAPFARSGFSFYFEQKQPYLRWERGEAVVERLGPQVIPMEGRGVAQVDLRIYVIDAMDRQFWPFGGSVLTVNEESRPPMPGDPVDTRERAVRALGSPDVSQIVELPIREQSPSTDFGLDLAPYLARVRGERAPGTYLVGYRALGREPTRSYVRVVVTDLDLSVVEEEHAVVFLVTSLSTGAPIAGAQVTVEGQDRNDSRYVPVVQGTTDRDGRLRYEHRARVEPTIRRIAVSYQNDVLTFDPSSPPPAFSNNHWHGSSARWLAWLNQDPVARRAAESVRAYILTERPIYRPEEAVHILGFVRSRASGAIGRDARQAERRVEIQGPGDRRWTYKAELDGYGQFSVDFRDSDVPTGLYAASLFDATLNRTLATAQFQVESYRVPRFEVQIHGADRVPVDTPFDLELVAEYYAGGRVIGRPVFWRITESSYTWQATAYPGFTFSSYESLGGGQSVASSGITRQETTDETGLAVLTIDPRTRQNPSAARYMVEGTVEGADGQRVTAAKSVVALPPFGVGIRQERFVRSSQALAPEIVVLDFDGRPLAGIPLTIRLYQRQWHSYLVESDFVSGEAEYRSDVVDELLREETHVSTAGITQLSYTLPESGVYVIEVLARDTLGRLQSVRVDAYLPGTSPVAWERTEGSVFRTTADKDAYRPGETARILLQSPFQEAAALAVVEGPQEVTYQWLAIKGGQAVLEVPITSRMVPRLPVHFLLMRGRVPGTESRYTPAFDRGRPVSVANTTYVSVLPVEHQASLTLKYPETSLPGTTIAMEIELKNHRGEPLDGQVALWLVDRAVLSLAQEKPIRPLDAFIDPVNPSVTIRDTRNQVVGNLPFRENPGGDGLESMREEFDILGQATVRRNFRTVPYYNPRIAVTGGRARVNIDLPDNLTDFAVRAVAVSGYSQFATATGQISVRLPVIIQSALPRFVRPGDIFSAGGVARIVEGPSGEARVQIRAEGLLLASGQAATRTIALERGVAAEQYFGLEVPASIGQETVRVTLGVERVADGVGDAFEMTLPVQDDVFLERRATLIQSSPGAETSFPVKPGEFRPGTLRQQLVVALDVDMLRLVGGLHFITAAPRQTTEQWASRLKAALRLQALLKEAGWERDKPVSQLVWEEFLSYLDTVRSPQGLYEQFPGGRGLVSLTAWVLDVMTLARAAGLTVSATAYDRTTRALQDALRSDYRYLVPEYGFQERAEALAALARAGRYDDGYGQSYLTTAPNESLYAAALLVSCLAEQGRGNQPRVRALVDHLWSATAFRLEGGQRYFMGLSFPTQAWGGYLMTTEIRTVSAVIRALSMSDPQDSRIPIMVDYLMRQGDGRGWGTTANTIEVLETLVSLAQGARKALPDIRFTLRFGSQTATLTTANRLLAELTSDAQAPGTVTQERRPEAQPWLTLEAQYRPDLPASQVAPRNDGFVVNRELQLVTGRSVSRRSEVGRGNIDFEARALVEEHVTVSNPEQRYYVAVHVPLASGFEPLNPELDTSGADAVASGRLTARPTYVRFLDDSVTYYYETLPAGTYHFYFRERATFAGTFQLPPAWAEAIYDPEVWGNSAGASVRIR